MLFICSVMSNSFRPHKLQHSRFPCPPLSPRAYSNSCPLSWWCHPPISSSAVPFSSCPQSFPASGSFQMSQFFSSGGQNFSFNNQSFQWTPRTDLLSLRIFIFRLICEIHLQVIFLLDCRHFRHTRPCTYGDLWYTYVLLASNQCFCSISSFL